MNDTLVAFGCYVWQYTRNVSFVFVYNITEAICNRLWSC